VDVEVRQVDGIRAKDYLISKDPEARIIIVTNLDQADLRQTALRAGAFAYVVKDNLFTLVNLLAAAQR
jgi:DNA-binding NarL/FixJ family response regulator